MSLEQQFGKAKPDNVAKAHASWGADVPDWVIVLAEACNRENQTVVGKLIGYSSGAVSQVLSNSYGKGNIGRVEQMVRGALMSETVACPIVGDLALNACLDWQRKPFDSTNSRRVRMYHACRGGCPHSRISPAAAQDDAPAD